MKIWGSVQAFQDNCSVKKRFNIPIEYTLEEDGAVVIAQATGVLTVESFLSMQSQMNADPKLRTPHKTLLDIRSVTSIQVVEDDLIKIARNLSAGEKRLGADKLAIVAIEEQAFKLGDKYDQTEKNVKESVIVFYNLDIARTWLGI